jgi:DNA repair photolyase
MLSIRGVSRISGVDHMDVRLVQCSTAAPPSRLPGLDWAVNPYRGCSHSCAYCYAQDVTRFEMGATWGSIVEVKVNIVQRLKKELSRKCTGVYGVGTVTDPYQPLEAEHELSRGCLSLLKRFGAQTSILTKSDLVLRDLDLLVDWPGVEVGLSIGTVDEGACSVIEPGAPAPGRRFEALRRLSDSGVGVYLMAAPIIPAISDSERSLHQLVEAADRSGVKRIVWDGWNPKPVARRRLESALACSGLVDPKDLTGRANRRVASVLRDECGSRGLQLADAF